MIATHYRRTALSLSVAGAIAAITALAGTAAVTAAPKADQTLASAQAALKAGKTAKAIDLVEAAVLANPQDPSYRALLGNAYLRAGRFESAVTAFDDAMTLGDNSAKTALALALANVAAGRNREAVALLDDWRDAIPADDLGLALALAGQSDRGVAVIGDAVRAGNASAKARQNLAYSLALDGRWREARVAMAQDVPADQIDGRIGEWAAQARPEDYRLRVAKLLSVPVVGDNGQPAELALVGGPRAQQASSETGVDKAPVVAAAGPSELPPVEAASAAGRRAPVPLAAVAVAPPAPSEAGLVEAAPAQVARASAISFVGNPVIQPIAALFERAFVPVSAPAAKPRAAPHFAAVHQGGTHLVQLGSFSSQQGARRAWRIYAAKSPALKGYRMTISQAQVRGKTYWRVAAAGFDAGSARGTCARIKAAGGMCFAYAARAIANPVRQAARTVKAKPKLAVR